MPNELGDSLFSPKSLLGERRVIRAGGRALVGLGPQGYQPHLNSEYQASVSAAVGRREMSFVVERQQPRPAAKVLKSGSVENEWRVGTARRLAQKQPSFKECVIAHWSNAPARIM